MRTRIFALTAALAVLSTIAIAQDTFIYGLVTGESLINVTVAEETNAARRVYGRMHKLKVGDICYLQPDDKVIYIRNKDADTIVAKRVKRYTWPSPTKEQLKAVNNSWPCAFRRPVYIDSAVWNILRADELDEQAKLTEKKKPKT